MRFGRIVLSTTVLALSLTSALPSVAMTHARRGPTSPKVYKQKSKSLFKKSSQMSIAPERATEIQVALIKTGYLSGEPTGVWDSSTQSAMQKLQGDNGWQTKLVPDSRAIIKLGLGPNQENVSLANPTQNETRSPSASTY
jgi:peptidoglycan hydrolase-like protein with peptidoglycan-binding domain